MSLFSTSRRLVRGESGGLVIRIVMAIVTLAIVGVFIVSLLNKKEQSSKFQHTEALRLAEEGFQAAMQPLLSDPLAISDVPRTEVRDGWYTVSMSTDTVGEDLVLTVKSTGGSGAITRSVDRRFKRPLSAASDAYWSPVSDR